jgi:hypothetical protein
MAGRALLGLSGSFTATSLTQLQASRLWETFRFVALLMNCDTRRFGVMISSYTRAGSLTARLSVQAMQRSSMTLST